MSFVAPPPRESLRRFLLNAIVEKDETKTVSENHENHIEQQSKQHEQPLVTAMKHVQNMNDGNGTEFLLPMRDLIDDLQLPRIALYSTVVERCTALLQEHIGTGGMQQAARINFLEMCFTHINNLHLRPVVFSLLKKMDAIPEQYLDTLGNMEMLHRLPSSLLQSVTIHRPHAIDNVVGAVTKRYAFALAIDKNHDVMPYIAVLAALVGDSLDLYKKVEASLSKFYSECRTPALAELSFRLNIFLYEKRSPLASQLSILSWCTHLQTLCSLQQPQYDNAWQQRFNRVASFALRIANRKACALILGCMTVCSLLLRSIEACVNQTLRAKQLPKDSAILVTLMKLLYLSLNDKIPTSQQLETLTRMFLPALLEVLLVAQHNDAVDLRSLRSTVDNDIISIVLVDRTVINMCDTQNFDAGSKLLEVSCTLHSSALSVPANAFNLLTEWCDFSFALLDMAAQQFNADEVADDLVRSALASVASMLPVVRVRVVELFAAGSSEARQILGSSLLCTIANIELLWLLLQRSRLDDMHLQQLQPVVSSGSICTQIDDFQQRLPMLSPLPPLPHQHYAQTLSAYVS